ncbi:hypothetical protein [Duganella sp. S19_KUP01_CR8]|uniref:hypothetical protein n=1 Tax=Duganella sp. S19_KUP01_CR8 TaxID=3025502 RepID=UPI002FCDAC45
MTYRTREAFDSRPLPFTPADAQRIARIGQLDALPSFLRPESLSNFYIEDIKGGAVLEWPRELPDIDPRGHYSAPRFEHWKKAQESRIGIAGNYPSFKGRGLVPCHSALERRHLSYFEMNPHIVEIRAQYPEWDRNSYRLHESLGLNMPKRGLITIDFVLTLKIPGEAALRYHAVSSKPHGQLTDPAVQRRHQREFDLLSRWGCTHQIMTEHSITRRHGTNCNRLFDYMRYVDDIGVLRDSALHMANSLLSQKTRGTCDQRIKAAAEKIGLSLNEGYRVFAVANFLGYLEVDHKYEILPDCPLVLLDKKSPIIEGTDRSGAASARDF